MNWKVFVPVLAFLLVSISQATTIVYNPTNSMPYSVSCANNQTANITYYSQVCTTSNNTTTCTPIYTHSLQHCDYGCAAGVGCKSNGMIPGITSRYQLGNLGLLAFVALVVGALLYFTRAWLVGMLIDLLAMWVILSMYPGVSVVATIVTAGFVIIGVLHYWEKV